MIRAITLAVFASFVAKVAYCEIIKYSDHLIMADRPEYLVIPKFDKREVPNWYPGRGRSFIDLSDIKIHSSCDPIEEAKRPTPSGDGQCKTVHFDILMFEDPKDRPWMDYWLDGDYCCTESVLEAGGYDSHICPH